MKKSDLNQFRTFLELPFIKKRLFINTDNESFISTLYERYETKFFYKDDLLWSDILSIINSKLPEGVKRLNKSHREYWILRGWTDEDFNNSGFCFDPSAMIDNVLSGKMKYTVRHSVFNTINKKNTDFIEKIKVECAICANQAQLLSTVRNFFGAGGNHLQLEWWIRRGWDSPEDIERIKDKILHEQRLRSSSEENMNRRGYSQDEIKEKKKEISLKIGKSVKLHTSKALRDNPDYLRENSIYCKEFWLRKGHTEEDAIVMAYKASENNRKKCKRMRFDDPEHFEGTLTNQVKYWTGRGFSAEGAEGLVTERQIVFSLDICIEKYGETKGLKVWKDRQEKWQEILDNKSDEEKLEINKKKLTRRGGYSKISQDLFWKIFNQLNDDEKLITQFYEHGGEKIVKIGDTHAKLDFCIANKVIEFDGTYWHGKYEINSSKKRDAERNQKIKDIGYSMLNIKEADYYKNEMLVLEECLKFIKTI